MAKPTTKKAAPKRKAAPKKASADAAPIEAKKPKARAPKAPKPAADERVVVMHGEMRIVHAPDAEAARVVEAIGSLADEVHVLGRVRITSVAHIGNSTTLHVVLPDHPQPYERHPGIILTIDSVDNLVSFDHVPIGLVSPGLVNDAAFALLTAIRGDDENPANDIGRRADWFEQAVVAAEGVADMHVALKQMFRSMQQSAAAEPSSIG